MQTPAHPKSGRRRFLAALGACAMTRPVASSAQVLAQAHGALTKEQRDRLTPAQVLDELTKGNERFRSGAMVSRDYRAQQRSSAAAQFPACVALGCVDSRVPAEVIFDVGIGDMFSARIAGNVVNDDLLGSLEFACAVAGAKVIALCGHTACGAIKGAIDDVEMGNPHRTARSHQAGYLGDDVHGREVKQERGVCRCRRANQCPARARRHPPAQPSLGPAREQRNHSDCRRDVRRGHRHGGVS
jgi:carbonic anhydrase